MLKEGTPIVELSPEQLELVTGGKYGADTKEGGATGKGADGKGGSGGRGGSDRAVGDPPASKTTGGSRLSCRPDVSLKEKRVGFECKYKF